MSAPIVVCYGREWSDLGVVVEDAGCLTVCWTDGHPDPVRRNKSGHLIHEHGVRLPIVSRRRGDVEPLLKRFRAAFEAALQHPPRPAGKELDQ